jgi:RNA polymerase sigma-70 factor (ECF subfamily)
VDAKTVAELVDEARRGSARARDELVRHHQRQIVILAASLVNDATEAEDLAQEAFIRAFRNLDLLVDPSRFGAWLRRIAVGVSIDWLRAFRPALYRGWSDADQEAVASRELSPLDRILRSVIVERVRAALDALPARYRVPIRLYHLDGQPREDRRHPRRPCRDGAIARGARTQKADSTPRRICAGHRAADRRAIRGAGRDSRRQDPLSARGERHVHDAPHRSGWNSRRGVDLGRSAL